MPVSLSIKNVPDELAERLRARAKQNHRSLQGELVAILEETVVPQRKLTVDEVLESARALGIRTPDESTQIIREERDSRDLSALLEENRPPGRLTVDEGYQRMRDSGIQTPDESVQIIRELRDSR